VEFADRPALTAMAIVEPASELGRGDTERRDAGPGRRAEGPDARAGSRDGTEPQHRRQRRSPLREHGFGALADEVGDRSPDGDREEGEPVQGQCRRRCIGETAVQLSETGHVGAPRTAGGQRGRPARRDLDAGGRGEHDASSAQAGADTEVEALIGSGESRVG
jgi:hypothetical protein